MSLFNVRVYGILVNDQQEILLSDEYIRGQYFTKFPGGGLEFGEGTLDCLRREWKEELDLEIGVVKHIYTTDFFQISAFDNTSQIISVYYSVRAPGPYRFRSLSKPFDFVVPEGARELEAPRWLPWEEFSRDSVQLPIDKVVASLIRSRGLSWLDDPS